MARYPDEINDERASSVSMTSTAKQIASEAPLLTAVARAFDSLDGLDQTVEQIYKRLDHLILHRPEDPDRDSIALAREGHSDTVTNVERVSERITESRDKLSRLLRIIEA